MAEVGESVAPIPPGVNISTSSGRSSLSPTSPPSRWRRTWPKRTWPRSGTASRRVTVEAIPDRRYKAVLRQVIPTADRTKATVMVKVTILDKTRT